jgi:hypothetical protein
MQEMEKIDSVPTKITGAPTWMMSRARAMRPPVRSSDPPHLLYHFGYPLRHLQRS